MALNWGLLDTQAPEKIAMAPANALARYKQEQAGEMQNELARLQLQGAQRSAAEEAAFSNALRGFNVNDASADISPLYQASPTKAMAFDKQRQEAAAARLKSRAEAFKLHGEKLGMYRDALVGVNSPQDAVSWITAQYNDPDIGPQMKAMGPLEVSISRIPQDPAGFAQWKQQSALGMAKFIEANKPTVHMQNTGGASNVVAVPGLGGAPSVLSSTPIAMSPAQEAEQKRAAAALEETRRHNRVSEGQRGQEISMGGKPPAGYRWSPTGALEAIPGGPATKPTEAQQKQLTGVTNLNNAIDEYLTALGSWNKGDIISPDARAKMGTKYNNMMLQAKEAYNLGVLNGPDYQILQSVVTDPRSVMGAVTSKSALAEQAGELQRIMSGVGQVAAQGQAPGSSAKPSQVAAKDWKSSGYASQGAAVSDARNAINAGADKAAVIQRLESMGITNHGIR